MATDKYLPEDESGKLIGDYSYMPVGTEGADRTLDALRSKRIFLHALAETGNIATASAAAGWKNTMIPRNYKRVDKLFSEAWDKAAEASSDILEAEAVRRATEGVMEPVYYQGDVVGYKLAYSDSLLQFLLKGVNPDKFRESTLVNHHFTGKVGVVLLPMTNFDLEDWERKAIDVHGRQSLSRDDASIIEGEAKDITPKKGLKRG